MNILDVFRNRPDKTVATFIALAVSIITFTMYQELKVETLGEFFNYISSGADPTNLWLTWGFNLVTFVLLIGIGIFWGKDIFNYNHMDEYPELGKFVSLIVGVLHLALSIVFLDYIFSDLLGIVIACVIVLAIIYGDNSSS